MSETELNHTNKEKDMKIKTKKQIYTERLTVAKNRLFELNNEFKSGKRDMEDWIDQLDKVKWQILECRNDIKNHDEWLASI